MPGIHRCHRHGNQIGAGQQQLTISQFDFDVRICESDSLRIIRKFRKRIPDRAAGIVGFGDCVAAIFQSALQIGHQIRDARIIGGVRCGERGRSCILKVDAIHHDGQGHVGVQTPQRGDRKALCTDLVDMPWRHDHDGSRRIEIDLAVRPQCQQPTTALHNQAICV